MRRPHDIFALTCLTAATLATGLAACAGPPSPTRPGEAAPAVVVSWNDLLLDVAEAEDHFLTLKGVRTAAMMHLAMHDALNAIDRRYRTYVAISGADGTVPGAVPTSTAGPSDADPVAAAAEAAYRVAVAQYPDREATFQRELARWTRDIAPPSALAAAQALGIRSANAVMATRDGDGWDGDPTYEWDPMGPGVYAEFNEHSGTPEGFVFGAGWGAARPFMLDSASQFRSPPPPQIEGDAYTAAFDEVKRLGRQESSARTPDQAHQAMWWKEFIESSNNRLGRELVADGELDLWEAARFFALLNMSVFDGYVASFEAKFHYNHWRPYTAIRWAANDGNPDTVEEPDWTNLHDHTYAFPSYPSAHGTVCGAAMTVFEKVFGDDVPFEMTIREVDSAGPMSPVVRMEPATRAFASFDDAAEECALSRVYLGIHFRYDSVEGTMLGEKVGEWAVERFLRPVERAP